MDYAAFRDSLGLTQEEIAELLGVSRQAWSLWETNQRVPSRQQAWRIKDLAEANGERVKLEDILPRSNGDE